MKAKFLAAFPQGDLILANSIKDLKQKKLPKNTKIFGMRRTLPFGIEREYYRLTNLEKRLCKK